jgi:outer membrane protein
MNRFHKKITFILIFFTQILRGPLSAQEASKMTLEEAVKYALAHSTAVKNARLNINDADLRIKESKAGGLPKVDAAISLQRFVLQPSVPASALGFGTPSEGQIYDADYTRKRFENIETKAGTTAPAYTPPAANQDVKIAFQLKNNFNGSITASQLIFSGSYTVALRAARFYKDLVNIQVNTAEEKLKSQVIDAYLPALSIDEAVKTFEKNIQNLEKFKAEVTATYKAGFVEQLDVDRLEFTVNNLKAQRDNLIRQRAIPLNVLKMVIGYPLNQPLELTDDINSLLKSIPDAALNQEVNYQKRAVVRELDASLKLLALNVELNKASGLPTVAAFANYQYSVQGNEFSKLFGVPSALIGITANYNIWDNNERKIKTQRAALALEQTRALKGDLERSITLEALNARVAIETAKKNFENQETNLALAQKIYDITKKKYKEGVGSSLEIITAERDIFAAQQTVRQAQYDILKAQLDLLKVIGD